MAITGQFLIDLTNDNLAGYANSVSDRQLLSHLNEAKDEVWTLLKSLQDEDFLQTSQNTDSTQLNYFPKDINGNPLANGALSTTLRDYTLPADFREIKFIEVTLKGYEQTVFVFKEVNSEDWKTARRSANVDPTLTPTIEYFYTIRNKKIFSLAQFPEVPFTLTLWYTQSLPDFEAGDVISSILDPYNKKMATYAAKKSMIGTQDPSQFALWTSQWKEDIISITTGSAPTNQSDAKYVEDFLG